VTTLLAFCFVLGVLVFVHELGHFLAAKRVGIRVLKFQLGFNPTILSLRRGETEYGIGALPLGGYVKMAGDSPDDVERDESGRPIPRPGDFLAKTKWERFQVLIMGPTMNILLAFVLMALVLYQGVEMPAFQDQPVVVGAVAADSPAAHADIRPRDRIISVGGHDVDTWEQFFLAIGARPNREIALRLLRGGVPIERTLAPPSSKNRGQFELENIGVLPDVHPHVPSLVSGDPAERAGVKVGDVIVAVNGEPVTFSSQLKDAIAKRPAQTLTLSILRDGAPQTVTVATADHGGKGWIGIGILDQTKSIKPGLVEAIGMSLQKNVEYAGLIFQTVWGLITRETSPKQLMGPVAIAQMSGESAQLGWIALFSLMASLSLNLGILNLLPIPVLDGGHIFIMALEGLARRDFSVRVKEKMLLAGFVALMVLMAAVIYNDLTRISWIERLMPWR
jgi:regulator of sigma E protease